MQTLAHALRAAAERDGGHLHFHLADKVVSLRSEELLERARGFAAALQARGVGRGDRVGLLGRNRPEWAVSAFGVWFAGAALVPLQVPIRVSDRAALVDRTSRLVTAADCSLVIIDPAHGWAVPRGLTLGWGATAQPVADLPGPEPDDDAVIQYTSGSTSTPKGVALTHRAVMAQMAMLGAVFDAHDKVASWVPFFHDLGLFHTLCFPVTALAASHLVPTDQFARAPGTWLTAADRGEATLLLAPQAGWLHALRDAHRRGGRLDLGRVRSALSGAEMVDPHAAARLIELAAPFGFDARTLGGAYGLAEATLAVTMTRPGEGFRTAEAPTGGRRVAGAGRSLPGVDVEIRNEEGTVQPTGSLGEIWVRSPSVMRGYLNQQSGGPDHAWLSTGDEGFLQDEELFMTGRIKDMMTVLGQNHYPEDFEWAATRVNGVRAGRVAAFMDAEREGIVVALEGRGDCDPDLARRVHQAIGDALGAPPVAVVLVPDGSILKTTSGKLRRADMSRAWAAREVTSLAESR